MRHHKARYPLAKERDYVFCESRAFFEVTSEPEKKGTDQ